MLKCINNKLLIQRQQTTESKGGIIIPDNAKETSQTAVVVESSVEDIPKGSTIVYNVNTVEKIKIDNVDYLIIDGDDVYGVFE